jgi:cytochrome bd-type quinol oxidase subunit 1
LRRIRFAFAIFAHSLFVRLSTGYSFTLRYAILHAFTQSPQGTAGSL